MKKYFNLHVIVNLALVIFGCWWLRLSLIMGQKKQAGDKGTWGTSATIPTFILVIFIILCIVSLINEIRKSAKGLYPPMDAMEKYSLGVACAMLAIIFVYAFAIDYLGYILCNIILMIIAMIVFQEKNKALIIGVPVGVTIVLYLVFRYLLEVSLPGFALLG